MDRVADDEKQGKYDIGKLIVCFALVLVFL
jgi:hypothetical protein